MKTNAIFATLLIPIYILIILMLAGVTSFDYSDFSSWVDLISVFIGLWMVYYAVSAYHEWFKIGINKNRTQCASSYINALVYAKELLISLRHNFINLIPRPGKIFSPQEDVERLRLCRSIRQKLENSILDIVRLRSEADSWGLSLSEPAKVKHNKLIEKMERQEFFASSMIRQFAHFMTTDTLEMSADFIGEYDKWNTGLEDIFELYSEYVLDGYENIFQYPG